jgi:hypothetical protein
MIFYSIVCILKVTNDERSGDQIIVGRRFMSSSNDTQKEKKGLDNQDNKRNARKNIQKCLRVFNVLYVGSNMLQMKKEYSI